MSKLPSPVRASILKQARPMTPIERLQEFEFNIGSRVTLDGHDDIPTVITAVAAYSHRILVQVAWMANGQHYEAWVDDFRLSKRRT